MDITVGTGKNRKTVTIPSKAAALINPDTKVTREQAIDALKSYLFRPAVLAAQTQ